MDFSVVLILPFAAIVALTTLLIAAALKRPRPRLVWPFAVSTLAVIPIFLRFPEAESLAIWIFSALVLAVRAAFGTIIGAMIAKLVIGTARRIRQS